MDADLSARLTAEIPSLQLNSSRYQAAAMAGTLWQEVPSDYPVASVTADEFVWLYDNRLVAAKAGREIYDRLVALARLHRCPYCNVNKPRSLDHFLPKRPFSTLAIEPWNLVPCCKDCNQTLGSALATGPEDYGFHPYFEKVVSDWLCVEIVVMDDAPAAVFSTDFDSSLDDVSKSRIAWAFETFGLAELYGSAAGGAIAELRGHAVKIHKAGGPGALEAHLLDAAESAAAVSENNWRAVLLAGLAASPWYCAGGFRGV